MELLLVAFRHHEPLRQSVGPTKGGPSSSSGDVSNAGTTQVIDRQAGVGTVVRELDQSAPDIAIESSDSLALVSRTDSATDIAVVRVAK